MHCRLIKDVFSEIGWDRRQEIYFSVVLDCCGSLYCGACVLVVGLVKGKLRSSARSVVFQLVGSCALNVGHLPGTQFVLCIAADDTV